MKMADSQAIEVEISKECLIRNEEILGKVDSVLSIDELISTLENNRHKHGAPVFQSFKEIKLHFPTRKKTEEVRTRLCMRSFVLQNKFFRNLK
jgi:hypothetical protein